MPTISRTEDFREVGGGVVTTAYQVFTGVGQTDWVRFSDTDITVQIDGSATSISVVIERAIIDPLSDVAFSYAPAAASAMSGNPSTGIPPNVYIEPGLGWWRARVTALVGTSATVSLCGAGLSA